MIPTRTELTETKKALRLCTLGHFSHVQLCNPVDCGLPGLSVSGVPQARILERAAIPFQSTVFPAALTAGFPEFLVWPGPL